MIKRLNGLIKGAATDEIRQGVIWNLASLVFLAIAGIALNVLIARIYGADGLGLFNIVFAMFILVSQFASFGIHLSALQAISTADHADVDLIRYILVSALASVIIACAVVIPVSILAAPLTEIYYGSVKNIELAWLVVVPGLLFFSINKVLLAFINGLNHMRAFAVFQSLRFLLILAVLMVVAMTDWPVWMLSGIISVSELILLPFLAIYTFRAVPLGRLDWSDIWSQVVIRANFGARAFLSGALLELNTRVDILMLGILSTVTNVGVYSIAVLAFDAAIQLVFIVRNNINPLIGRAIARNDMAALLKMSRSITLYLGGVYFAATLAVYILYPYMAPILFDDPEFLGARIPMTILMAGLIFSGGMLTFGMALGMANRPGSQTLFIMSVVVINFVANVILIPAFGMSGAAAATAIATISSGFLAVMLARALIGLNIISP